MQKGEANMKILAAFVIAAFVLTIGTSLAFAECAGHSQARQVKIQQQEQISKDQTTKSSFTLAEKTAEPTKATAQSSDKK